MNPRTCLFLAAALLFVASAEAQTLYKLIGKDGKVTYSEKPPKDFDGKVIRMDIDPNANTATLPKGTPPPADRGETGARKENLFKRDTESADRVAVAQASLDNARKALEDARANPGPGEVDWVGNKGGGTRATPTEAYQRRLEKLEQAVKEAEDALQKAEQGR